MDVNLQAQTAGGGATQRDEHGVWRMEIPAGPEKAYRLAQLDDYARLSRKAFRWRAPASLELRARVSAAVLPGTWGFGFWNDPFSAGFIVKGTARQFPALPEAAWFFYAGKPNYLAFSDHHPAQGALAATFSSTHIPALLLAPGIVVAPLLALPLTARLVRRMARRVIHDDAALLSADVTGWHAYRIDWQPHRVQCFVDGQLVFDTPDSPRGPLGFVTWIDNQYAAFPSDGRIKMGSSANPEPAWLEIEGITIT